MKEMAGAMWWRLARDRQVRKKKKEDIVTSSTSQKTGQKGRPKSFFFFNKKNSNYKNENVTNYFIYIKIVPIELFNVIFKLFNFICL